MSYRSLAALFLALALAACWELVPNGLPDSSTRALLAYQKSNQLFVVTVFDATATRGTGWLFIR